MTPRPPADDPTLAALDEYLAAAEAGPPPAVAEFLARHPAAPDLAAAFAALAALRGDAADDEPVVHSLGEYQILGEAGRGGTGVVYQALQFDPPRPVALKVLAPGVRSDPSAVRRFAVEVHVAGRLHHTNIVPVLATVPGADGPAGYAMPFIRGASLAAVLRAVRGGAAGSCPVAGRAADLFRADRAGYARAAVEWVRQAAEAVSAAHAAGVTHRDVKPGNLLLEFDRAGRPHVWLHDFGLAVRADDPDELDGQSVGTPGYRSPEQRAGGPAGRLPPTDVYALGVTLAEVLTLARPPDGGPVPVPRHIPRELRRVIAHATAADPAARYPTAAGFADDLARYLAGFPVRGGRRVWGRGPALWAARHRRALASAAAAFAIAAAVGAVLLAHAYSAERAARRAADAGRRAVATHTLAIDDTLYASPGMLDTQRQLLEQAAEVHRLHLALAPADRAAARNLAQAEWRLGRVYVRLDRPADGVEQLRRSIAGYSTLVAAEPDFHLHRLDLARSYSVLAWAAGAAGRPADADAATSDAYRVVQVAVAAHPGHPDVRDAFASYAAAYGERLFRRGRSDDAEGVLRAALEAAAAGVQANPEKWRYTGAAVATRMQLARVLAGRGRTADALTVNAAALDGNAAMLARVPAPTAAGGRLDLLSHRMTRAELLIDRAGWAVAAGADLAGVRAELEASARVIAAEHPDRVREEQLRVAEVRAWEAYRAGRPDPAAARAFEAALAGKGSLVSRSRFLADGPGDRDPARAEALAREALADAPDDPPARAALGLALFRAGRFADAEAELARVGDRPPHRSVGLARAAIAGHFKRPADARRLLAENEAIPAPREPCHPELEREAKAAVGG